MASRRGLSTFWPLYGMASRHGLSPFGISLHLFMASRTLSTQRPIRNVGDYRQNDAAMPRRTTFVFATKDYAGALEQCLSVFTRNDVNMTRIESRYGQKSNVVNFFVDLDLPSHHRKVKKIQTELLPLCVFVDQLGSKEVPWFPVTMEEVDSLALLVLEGGVDLENPDHPGFHDPEYRQRRQIIADAAARFKFGDTPEIIGYTEREIECWGVIWRKLYPLLMNHACDEYLEVFAEFQKECEYREDNIPQLADVSGFIYDRTGFRLRPTAGLISSRHFLNGLAFNTFFCTQYLRHPDQPLYTPEPDVVHELVGHAPLFANPDFARFSQEIGLASIGATDEQIVQLARCYWFSVEFGLCRKHPGSKERKIYGAGVLSSFGEIEWSMSDEPEIRDWDPFEAATRDYPITKYQPLYYLADSFTDAKLKMQHFAASLEKPFSVRWDDIAEKLITDRQITRQPRDDTDIGSYGD